MGVPSPAGQPSDRDEVCEQWTEEQAESWLPKKRLLGMSPSPHSERGAGRDGLQPWRETAVVQII